MKILVLAVCYGTGTTSPAPGELKSMHAALRDGSVRDYLIIDNALVADYCRRLDEHTTLVGGDNTCREFSGWDRALAFLGPRLDEYAVVHLATETFNTDYRHYLGLLTPKILSLVAERNLSVGHLDGYPREVELFGVQSRSWIRSCCLLAPTPAIRALGSLVTARPSERFFSGDPCRPFHPEAPIDAQYRQYLWRWLTGDGGSSAEINCHRESFAVTPETLERFEAKAVAVVNEHALSVRLRGAGYPTVDIEWLYDMLLARPPESIDPFTPLQEMLRYTAERRRRLGITPP